MVLVSPRQCHDAPKGTAWQSIPTSQFFTQFAINPSVCHCQVVNVGDNSSKLGLALGAARRVLMVRIVDILIHCMFPCTRADVDIDFDTTSAPLSSRPKRA